MKTRLPSVRRRARGFTLPELVTTMVITSVIVLVGWTTWEMIWAQTRRGRETVEAQRVCFGVVQRIEQEIKRAQLIEIPSPTVGSGTDSIRLTVRTNAGLVRRIFRRDTSTNKLMVDMPDEGVASYAAFPGVTGLLFEYVNAPTNTMVRVTCTTVENGQNLQMQTVTFRRN